MSQARVLYDLQQIDTEIRTKKQRLGEVLRLQKEPPPLVAARERVATIDADLQKWQARHRALTADIAALADKTKREEDRLYSGVVKNTKELNDLQREVEALGRRRATLEDEALLVMMEADDRQTTKRAAEDEVARLAGEFTTASATYRQEQQVLATHLNQLIEKRGRHITLAQPALIKTYDDLIRQKNGLAVAGLQANKCLGCRLTLSASVIRAVDEGKLIFCENCGRILCPI